MASPPVATISFDFGALEQLRCSSHADVRHTADKAIGGSSRLCRLFQNTNRLSGALRCRGMWKNDNSIARLDGGDRVEYCRGCRVGRRNHSSDDDRKARLISMILLVSSRLITPSVRTSLIDIHTFFDANWFLIVLCSATPMCVLFDCHAAQTLGRFVWRLQPSMHRRRQSGTD